MTRDRSAHRSADVTIARATTAASYRRQIVIAVATNVALSSDDERLARTLSGEHVRRRIVFRAIGVAAAAKRAGRIAIARFAGVSRVYGAPRRSIIGRRTSIALGTGRIVTAIVANAAAALNSARRRRIDRCVVVAGRRVIVALAGDARIRVGYRAVRPRLVVVERLALVALKRGDGFSGMRNFMAGQLTCFPLV